MSTSLSILGKGYGSFEQCMFRSVKSTHIHHFLFFFLTMTTFASHSGYWTGLMTLVSNSLCTSAFVALALSVDIFLNFCFLRRDPFVTLRLCWARFLLTPWRSLADQAKTSSFSCRNEIRFCFSWSNKLVPIWRHLSGTASVKGVFWVSSPVFALGLMIFSLFCSISSGFLVTSLMRLYPGIGLPSMHLEAS